MGYVIAVILTLIVLIIYGLLLRKKVYDAVDQLESWKMQITNRPVTEELAKIKHLNLSGETQEKFETWRQEWDDILAKHLPDLEEGLFDAEEYADKYRFRSAKKVLKQVEERLQSIENSINGMFDEVDTLLHSEENSRKDVEALQPYIKEFRKKLLQQRHRYGKAEVRFEMKIDELEERMLKYYQLVEQGDYFEAHELVQETKGKMEQLEEMLEEFPTLYKACHQELPSDLDDLQAGIRQMKEDGYHIEIYGFEKEIQKYQEELVTHTTALEKAEMDGVKPRIEEIDERIQQIYSDLEDEAVARNYVEQNQPQLYRRLQETKERMKETKNELERLQHTYQLEDKDLEMHMSLEKWLSLLTKHFDELKTSIDEQETAHSSIRSELENWETQLAELIDQHDQFKERLHTLRKGEREASEHIDEMKKELLAVHRKLQKSNIPGVPVYIRDVLQAATEALSKVDEHLDCQPLDMVKVHESLDHAKKEATKAKEQTELLLDQAYMAEQVIQYANRYRSKDPFLAAKLADCEGAFRSYEYDVALEQASEALEKVEPGALKRIESNMTTSVG